MPKINLSLVNLKKLNVNNKLTKLKLIFGIFYLKLFGWIKNSIGMTCLSQTLVLL